MTETENKINQLLAQWDLTGAGLVHPDFTTHEYISYVKPIIEFYKTHKTVYSYLIKIFADCLGGHEEKDLPEIKEYADKMNAILESAPDI